MKHRHFSRKVWHHRKHLGNKNLDGLPKLKLSPSIVFVCGRCFTPNLNQLQNSERFYIPYNLTIPHCLKPTLLLLYPFFLNLSWIQPAPQPHPDSFLPPPCTARVWLSSRSINASPAFGTPNPGKISHAIIEFEGVSAVQGDWKCLLVHVSGWRWLHGCIPTKALRLVICRKSWGPAPKYAPLNPLDAILATFLTQENLKNWQAGLGNVGKFHGIQQQVAGIQQVYANQSHRNDIRPCAWHKQKAGPSASNLGLQLIQGMSKTPVFLASPKPKMKGFLL